MTENFYCTEVKHSIWERLIRWLFPVNYLLTPGSGEWITTHAVAELDWKDRLRVMLSGRVHIHIITEIDAPVRKCESKSIVYVEAPQRKRGNYDV
jgi:hypothetical protein